MSEINKEVEVTEKNKEKGASLVEYALLVALIAVVCIAAITTFGRTVSQQFSQTSSKVNN